MVLNLLAWGQGMDWYNTLLVNHLNNFIARCTKTMIENKVKKEGMTNNKSPKVANNMTIMALRALSSILSFITLQYHA